MVNLHHDVLEFVTRAEHCQQIDELVDDFSALAARHGFPIFILTGLPSKNFDVEPLVIANHWPVEWSERYREQMYFPDDPVSTWSLARAAPFRWLDAQRGSLATGRTRQIAGEAWEAGLADGYAFPLPTAEGGAVVSLASDATIRHAPLTQAMLYLASSYFHFAAQRLLWKAPVAPLLTDRERELLKWAAGGKTAWEIGQILSIAESTVKTHLKSIRAKFGVATTTQAVAFALSRNEIQL